MPQSAMGPEWLPEDLAARMERMSSEIPAHVVRRFRELVQDTYERGVDDGQGN